MGSRADLDGGKSRPTGIRFPDHPARSQSLYRLRKCKTCFLLGGIRRRERYKPIFLVSIGREISFSEELAASVLRHKTSPYVAC